MHHYGNRRASASDAAMMRCPCERQSMPRLGFGDIPDEMRVIACQSLMIMLVAQYRMINSMNHLHYLGLLIWLTCSSTPYRAVVMDAPMAI